MDVAEDERNARLIELNDSGAAALVEPKIETFTFEQRKDIVKEGIVIGELHLPTCGDDENRGLKALVLLNKLRDARLSRRFDGGSKRRQPYNSVRPIFQPMSALSDLDKGV